MYYSDEFIEEIRERNDIVDVISGYVKLQKKGSTYFGLCPFHHEKSPSFSVTPSKQMYYCFGCGEGGNVISFIMKYENYSFTEAVEYLADRAGISLPEVHYSKEEKQKKDLKNSLLEINKEAAKYFVYALKDESGQVALDYFKRRELTDETIRKFGLGYCSKQSKELYAYLKDKGFEDELLKKSGLFTYSEKGVFCKFFNRVMYPIMDINNRVIGFGGRVMGEGEPKYLNSPETELFDKSRNLYGMNYARSSKASYMLLCEGYMDVIALQQAGFVNAVASLGTAFTSQQASLIKRYVNEVYITYDSDGAGRKAALRAIPILRQVDIKVKVVNMKPYKDPDEFIKALGREEYEKRIKDARNGFLFTIDCMAAEKDFSDIDAQSEFQKMVVDKLLEIENDLERNVYIEAVSKEYRIPTDLLKRAVGNKAMVIEGKTVTMQPKPLPKRNEKRDDGVVQSQKILITRLVENPEIFEKISGIITADDFIDPVYHQVVELLFEQLRKGSLNPAMIINHFQSEEEHKEVASLFNRPLREDMTPAELEKAINEIVIKVKQNSLDYMKSKAETIEDKQNILLEIKKLKTIQIRL